MSLHRALDEARFGSARTLDLRASLPSVADAVRRAEAWLRERQMAKSGEVLVITGRGKGSPGGVGLIREAMIRLFAVLRRKGVVSTVGEHTAGSFVVVLAPIRALFETVPRSRARAERLALVDPAELRALPRATLDGLRWLAERSLEALGAPRSERFVLDEMRRQFGVLSGAIAPEEADRDDRLRRLIEAAADAFDAAR